MREQSHRSKSVAVLAQPRRSRCGAWSAGFVLEVLGRLGLAAATRGLLPELSTQPHDLATVPSMA